MTLSFASRFMLWCAQQFLAKLKWTINWSLYPEGLTLTPILVHLHNGTCNVTSHHEKTIEEVCKMNNRFFSIDLSKSHLEMHTFDSTGKKERVNYSHLHQFFIMRIQKLLNWSEPSSKYANLELWLKTTDEAYLKSVAANTHCFEVKRKSRKNCSICGGNFFSLPRKLWKCT